jgi:hypothetical protein
VTGPRRGPLASLLIGAGVGTAIAAAALRQLVRRPAAEAPDRAPDLDALTKDELYERAQAEDIPGRSRMSKAELVAALRRVPRRSP